MRERWERFAPAIAVLGFLLNGGTVAEAQTERVDLLFSPTSQSVVVGETFEIGLIARSGTGAAEPFSALQAILQWDDSVLRFLGRVDNGPYAWLSSDFPVDPDMLNASFNDGDALYQALGQFPPNALPIASTGAGLLVTTLQFEALQAAPMTQVSIPLELGSFTQTIVTDPVIPGLNILRDTGVANVTVVPEPTTAAFMLLLSSGVMWSRRRKRRHGTFSGVSESR